MSSSGEMKMSLKLMICGGAQRTIPRAAAVDEEGLYILMAQMFEKFQFTIRPLRQYRGAERFHDLLDRNRLSGKLILSRAVESAAVRMCETTAMAMEADRQHTRRDRRHPSRRAGDQCICRGRREHAINTSEELAYRLVISKVVPKIWARTNSAMAAACCRRVISRGLWVGLCS